MILDPVQFDGKLYVLLDGARLGAWFAGFAGFLVGTMVGRK